MSPSRKSARSREGARARPRGSLQSTAGRPNAEEARRLVSKGACPHCLTSGTFKPTGKSHIDTDKLRMKVYACSACGWEEGRPATETEARRERVLRGLATTSRDLSTPSSDSERGGMRLGGRLGRLRSNIGVRR